MNHAPDNNHKKKRPILLGVLMVGAFVALVITERMVLSPVVF